MVNEVSSGVVITPDKTIITYLLKEEDWQKDAAKQCKEACLSACCTLRYFSTCDTPYTYASFA